MASCKDCVHYEVCQMHYKQKCELTYETEREVEIAMRKAQKAVDIECDYYKDRSRFVELPCVAGEYVYVIEPIFGKSIEHTIRRRKIKSIEPHAEIKFYGGWIHDFLSGFGRYIFSTYEEAKQALKECEENAN